MTDETIKHFVVLSPVSVSTTAAQLAESLNIPDGIKKGIMLKAPGTNDDTPNTKSVFLGHHANVTADQTATGGFPIAPGESITIPIEDIDRVWHIATDTAQKLNAVIA